MCCKVIRVVELEKPAGVWCKHAAPGHGCGIYPDRPTPCQVFRCVWLDQADTPDALKPERTKVVLASSGRLLIAHCDPADPTAWRRDPIHAVLKREAWAGGGPPRPVLVKVGQHIWLVTAGDDHDLGDVDITQSFRVEPGPDGKPVIRLTGPEVEAHWVGGAGSRRAS
jgi:hypothetical protein